MGDKLVVWIALAGTADPGPQCLAPRRGALGQAGQHVGQTFALALDVEHVAVARRVAPGGPLPGARALPGIGDRVVGPQPLHGGVQQVHAPGVRVAAVCCGKTVAVGRRCIDAGQHGRGTLEHLVVQAHANARQVLVVVDRARLPRGRLEHAVDAAHADRHAEQVAQELHGTAMQAAADQRQPDDHRAQPRLGHRQPEQHRAVRHGRRECAVERSTGFARLLVDELAAHPMPGGQVAHRFRSRQRLNGQLLALAPGQPRCRTNSLVHTRTIAESMKVRSLTLVASTRLHV